MFACWFQSGLFNQLTVFFSHNKTAPASSNPPRNQPANTRIDAEDFPATATFQDVTQEQQMNPVTMDVM